MRLTLLALAILLVGCGVKQPDGSVIDMKQDRANREIAACIARGGTATSASRWDSWAGYVIEVTCSGMTK